MDRGKSGGWGLGAGSCGLGRRMKNGSVRLQPDLIIAALLTLVPQSAWAQCAMCARALQSEEGQHMIAAFRGGILLMLVVPFALVAIIGALAVRRFRHIGQSSSETADAKAVDRAGLAAVES
jgi:hypothetical protein